MNLRTLSQQKKDSKPVMDAANLSEYSISVTYDEKGKPIVQVKTYGDVDVAELRRDIKQRYLGARIEGLEKKPLIRVVDKEEEKEENRSEKKSSTGS